MDWLSIKKFTLKENSLYDAGINGKKLYLQPFHIHSNGASILKKYFNHCQV
jgi:hypothetical protein